MSLRTKEKVNNAKSLAFLSSWVFFFLDRAADRPVSNTEPNYLPGVKENVSFDCSGFSWCNKSLWVLLSLAVCVCACPHTLLFLY